MLQFFNVKLNTPKRLASLAFFSGVHRNAKATVEFRWRGCLEYFSLLGASFMSRRDVLQTKENLYWMTIKIVNRWILKYPCQLLHISNASFFFHGRPDADTPFDSTKPGSHTRQLYSRILLDEVFVDSTNRPMAMTRS